VIILSRSFDYWCAGLLRSLEYSDSLCASDGDVNGGAFGAVTRCVGDVSSLTCSSCTDNHAGFCPINASNCSALVNASRAIFRQSYSDSTFSVFCTATELATTTGTTTTTTPEAFMAVWGGAAFWIVIAVVCCLCKPSADSTVCCLSKSNVIVLAWTGCHLCCRCGLRCSAFRESSSNRRR